MTQTKVEAPFVANNANFRNVIINGDMSISQRATGTTTISGTAHNTLDRFAGMESTGGTATLEQHSMSVADQATTGQRYAALWKCSGTDSSIGAAEYAGLQYFAEAQHLQHFLYGTSAAKDLTLSFWVKSNTTGTYSIGIYKPDNTGYYHPTTYAISSADTWEKKVIHISPTAGSTSLITASGGAIANDNGLGIAFYFYTALGSNYHTSAINTWSTTADFGTSDQPNLMSSTDNNWYITGVQLEVGDQASDFEHIPHDVTLQRCMRYYETSNPNISGNAAVNDRIAYIPFNPYSTSVAYGTWYYKVQKRAAPTITHNSAVWNVYQDGAVLTNSGQGNTDGIGFNNMCIYLNGWSNSGNADHSMFADYRAHNGMTFDSEL